MDALFIRQFLSFLCGLDLFKINACVLFDGVDHGQTLKGLSKVDLHLRVGDGGGVAHFLGNMAEHVFCQIHHAVVVRVSLVKLHKGKFRVVPGVQALIAEHAADLVDSLHAAYDQPFQIQLQGDPELYVLVQGVVVGLKGPCRGAAGVAHQHGGLNLQKSQAV